MFTEKDVQSHLRLNFSDKLTRTRGYMEHAEVGGGGAWRNQSSVGGRMIAKNRQEGVSASKSKIDQPRRFSLSATLNANSRISIEQFRKKLPADSPADRMSPASISSQCGVGVADSPCRFGAKIRLTS